MIHGRYRWKRYSLKTMHETTSGTNVKPEEREGNAASRAAAKTWTERDNKAKSDIILSIKPTELKQIKGCVTSRDV